MGHSDNRNKELYPKVYLYRRLVQARLFIDRNYSLAIDLGNIADEACFSKFHFLRLFKHIYGQTPHQYLMTVRMEGAKLLLQKGHSIADTCYLTGFDSISSFSGLFKRTVGVTPAAYALYQKKLRADIQKAPLKFIPNCFVEKKGWVKKSNFEEAEE